jgi:hypothetical protein
VKIKSHSVLSNLIRKNYAKRKLPIASLASPVITLRLYWLILTLHPFRQSLLRWQITPPMIQ